MGHLFQGRYKALLVDRDAYLLELVRYIHLNPVRAGLVDEPLDYRWTGHRAYLGKEQLPWLCTNWVLSQFDDRLGVARRRYRAFVRAGTNEGYREEFHSGGEDPRILRDDGFLASVLKEDSPPPRPPNLKGLIRAVCRQSFRITKERAPCSPLTTSRLSGRICTHGCGRSKARLSSQLNLSRRPGLQPPE
jgi:hypothetical protein